MSQQREYGHGRSTAGWRKGLQIARINEVNPGNVIIGVSHQFQAENLYVVVKPPFPSPSAAGFWVRFINPDGSLWHLGMNQSQWVWDFDLTSPEGAWYHAVKEEGGDAAPLAQ